MNFLYILQQSVYTNNGKWTTADSNIDMMCGILSQLHTLRPKWHFYVLIGKKDDFNNLASFDEIYNLPNVTFVEYDFPVNAFTNRYHFDVVKFKSLLNTLPRIDIIWNNIIELSRNIKTVLFELGLDDIKLISCNYWMDMPNINQEKVPLNISYDWRQFDGAECSDLCPFTCRSTQNGFFENAKYKFSQQFIDNIREKSTIWDFGYSATEFDVEYPRYEIPTILFLNRLSGINYTHYKEFINAVNELYERRQDFRVVFTNPSQKISWDELSKQVKPLNILWLDVLDRARYIQLLKSSHISCHLFLTERYGGCAMRESLECRNIIVAPKVYEYNRILGDNYPFYVKSDFSNLTSVLSKAVDNAHIYTYPDDILQRNSESSYEYVADKVVSDILNLLKD